MRYSTDRSFRAQFDFLRRQFLQDGELALADIPSRETIEQALDTIEVAWNEPIFTPRCCINWVLITDDSASNIRDRI